MTVKSLVCRIVVISLLLAGGCAKKNSRDVASVLGHSITAEEFQARYKTYLSSSGVRDNIVQRKAVLDNIINEHLILNEIQKKGWDKDSAAMYKLEEIRTQALLNGYTRTVLLDTLSVTEKELWDEFRASNTKVSARYIYAKTKSEALALKKKLEGGATFKALAKDIFEDPGLANNGGSVGYFGHGEMESAFEEAAFALPVGAISEPIKIGVGYALIKVDDRVEIPLSSQIDFEKKRESMTTSIREKKTMKALTEAAHKASDELSPQFNESALQLLKDAWTTKFTTSGSSVLEQVESKLKENPSLELVKFSDGTWTMKDFEEKVRFTSERARRKVKTVDDLKEFILGLRSRDEFLKRARIAGVERDSVVKNETDKATLLYFLRRWSAFVQDTIGRHGIEEAALKAHFEQNRSLYINPPEVNVAEILVRSANEAAALRANIDKGADFASLARKHSLRTWAAKKGGELGFGTEASYGMMGKKLFSSRVGQVVGPAMVDPYYGIFKILERKESTPKSFEEVRGQILKEQLALKKQDGFKQALVNLRSHAKFEVYEDVLANISFQ